MSNLRHKLFSFDEEIVKLIFDQTRFLIIDELKNEFYTQSFLTVDDVKLTIYSTDLQELYDREMPD